MDPKNDGPTVFDINRPNTYGANPSARPVITGHQPSLPDPMVTAAATAPSTSKIDVKVADEQLDRDQLASSLFPEAKSSNDGAIIKPAVMAGEPQLSPPFKPDGDPSSAAQRAPYMPVSDLTGITQTAGPPPKTIQQELADEQITTDPKPGVFGSSNGTPVNGPKHPKDKGLALKNGHGY